jgi:hypothetical protein
LSGINQKRSHRHILVSLNRARGAIMSSCFESMVNEMVRWGTTSELKEKAPEEGAGDAMREDDELDLDDEVDADEEVSSWPSSGRSISAAAKKTGAGSA